MKIRIFATGADGTFKAGMTDLDVDTRVGLATLGLAASYLPLGAVAFVFDEAPLDPRRVISVTEVGVARSLLTIGDAGDYRIDVFVEDELVNAAHPARLAEAVQDAYDMAFDYS